MWGRSAPVPHIKSSCLVKPGLPVVVPEPWFLGSCSTELPKENVLMLTAMPAHLDPAIGSLAAVVAVKPGKVAGASAACGLIDSVELLRRLAAVATVDVLEQIHVSRTFYDQGHANARVMFAHIAEVSGAEAHRLDKIRRMVDTCELINNVWRAGDLSIDKAGVLGRAFANPRTRDRFMLDQAYFLKHAGRRNVKRFEQRVARWAELHDCDGPDPAPDPSHERRDFNIRQEPFAKAWKIDGSVGSLDGSTFHETWQAYVDAEFAHDWARAEKLHGPDTSRNLLDRTDAQRRADALIQMAADAVNSDKPSAPIKRVHNIVWNAKTLEELIRRWVNSPARILDPDSYNISDLDGHPIAASEAFADLLVSSFRRVIQNAAGVTINMSQDTRLFTGLARLGVQLTTTQCYWPGCCVPTSRCHIDHLKPAARGGTTEQTNGLPACPRHNRLKERGYTVTRQPNGTITTPTGEPIH